MSGGLDIHFPGIAGIIGIRTQVQERIEVKAFQRRTGLVALVNPKFLIFIIAHQHISVTQSDGTRGLILDHGFADVRTGGRSESDIRISHSDRSYPQRVLARWRPRHDGYVGVWSHRRIAAQGSYRGRRRSHCERNSRVSGIVDGATEISNGTEERRRWI